MPVPIGDPKFAQVMSERLTHAGEDREAVRQVLREGLDGEMRTVEEIERKTCPFDFAHTRHWCGYDSCRES